MARNLLLRGAPVFYRELIVRRRVSSASPRHCAVSDSPCGRRRRGLVERRIAGRRRSGTNLRARCLERVGELASLNVTKGDTMSVQRLTGCATAAAILGFITVGAAQASMYPAVNHPASNLHHIDCAVGFHIGPLGTCVIGDDSGPPPPPPPDRVIIEHRSADEGCE